MVFKIFSFIQIIQSTKFKTLYIVGKRMYNPPCTQIRCERKVSNVNTDASAPRALQLALKAILIPLRLW